MGGGRTESSSSSGEEDGDGDANWRAAIDSVTASSIFTKPDSNGSSSRRAVNGEDDEDNYNPQNLKYYQIKAQKLLEEMLDKTIEVVAVTDPVLDNDPAPIEDGVRLFKNAPVGIVFDSVDKLQGPKKKPKIIPGEEVNEKSKKFRKQLQSVAIDGADIIAAARAASHKSLAKLEAKEAAAKAAAKQEEERVEKLKKIRGERWLPSIARQMRSNNR